MQLERDYRRWLREGPHGRSPVFGGDSMPPVEEIFLIWPMIKGTCRGLWTNPHDGTQRYVYGPCHHLGTEKVDGKQLACCLIHDIRPRLCHGYPCYGRTSMRPVESSANGTPTNPGYMRGCGYNEQKDAGFRLRDFNAKTIRPLRDDEKEGGL